MIKQIFGKIFKALPITLTIISFAASIYAANIGIEGPSGGPIGYGAAVVFGVIIALYFFGMYLDRKPSVEETE